MGSPVNSLGDFGRLDVGRIIMQCVIRKRERVLYVTHREPFPAFY